MSVEGPNLESQPVADPLQVARREFNQSLFGEYNGGAILNNAVRLQNVLYGSGLPAERLFHELTLVAGQGADLAELREDAQTAQTLRSMQTGYELAYTNLKPQVEASASKPVAPTPTEALAPMTSAKGVIAPRSKAKSPKKSTADTALISPENVQPALQQPEEQQLENQEAPQPPQKKRGRPRKNPQ